MNKELMETVATNIADILVNFERDYKSFDGETLENHLEEFGVVWLEGSDEYVIAFGCELLFDGFASEEEANKAYTLLENRAYEIAITEQAKLFAYREFELSKVKLPSIRDFKGRNAYRDFSIAIKEATTNRDNNEEFYKENVSKYGELFVEQVDKERREIGKKYFGFN